MKLAYRVLAISALASIAVSAMAQGQDAPKLDPQGKTSRRIKIRHADPYLIFLMLKGNQSTNVPPETSTVVNAGGGNGGFGGQGFGGGGQGPGSRGNGPGFGIDGPGNRSGNRNPGSGPGMRSGF